MSYNPVRAAQPYRNTSKKRQRFDPHAGTKHSDIMKRQGLGSTVPFNGRVNTPYGFAVNIFESEGFAVRSEVIGPGNNLGLGFNDDGDCVYHVTRGLLYVTVEQPSGECAILKVQAGSDFRAPRGTKYSVASSGTEAVELLVVESPGYAAGWQNAGEVSTRALVGAVLSGETPIDPEAPPVVRRRDQSQAKQAAGIMAAQKGRRVPKNQAAAQRAGQTMTGATKVGRNAATNPNSSSVAGVNPMPAGPGAYSDND